MVFGFLNPDGLAKPTAKGKGKGRRKLLSEPTKAESFAAFGCQSSSPNGGSEKAGSETRNT